jgi:CHAT domain-containing protein
MEHTGFPSEETLAAFIDGRLDDETRRRVVEHMANCTECYETFLGATEWGREGASSNSHSERRSVRQIWFAALPAAVAAALAVVFLIPSARDRVTEYWYEHRTGLGGLVAVANQLRTRPVEARLSGRFEYRPFEVTRGEDNNSEDVDHLRLSTAALNVAVRATNKRSPEELHAHGVAALLIHKYDDAVNDLGACVQIETGAHDVVSAIPRSRDAAALIDLSAALYSRAVRTRNKGELALAFEAASQAADVAPKAAEAHFQMALALERLNMVEEARVEWNRYLQLDSDSQWAAEVRSRIADLKSPSSAAAPDADRLLAVSWNDSLLRSLVAADPQNARTVAEETILPRWASALLTNRESDAAPLLVAVGRIGDTVASVSGDHTVADCASAANAASDSKGIQMARAFTAFGDARALYKVATNEDSRRAAVEAATQLERIGSPLAPRAFAYAATISNYLGHNTDALDLVNRSMASAMRNARFPVAHAQLEWAAGMVEYSLGRPEEAIHSLLNALDAARLAGEAGNIAGIETMLGTTFRYIGDNDQSWSHTLAAVDACLRGPVTFERHQNAIDTAARLALRSQCAHLSVALAREILSNARQNHDVVHSANALILIGTAETALGNFVAADSDFRQAAGFLAKIPNSGTRTRLEADHAVAYAEMLTRYRPKEAIAFLDSAIAKLSTLGILNRLPRLYLALGNANRTLGNVPRALIAYKSGIREIEEQRSQLTTESDRSTFTDTARALLDHAVQLTNASEPNAALDLVLGSYRVGLTSDSRVSTDIANGCQVSTNEVRIVYYVLPEALFVWTISPHEQQLRRVPISSDFGERVQHDVAVLRESTNGDSGTKAAADLYERLIAPVRQQLPLGKTLVIAPDGPLNQVPFAALYDTIGRYFLIERYPIVVAASAHSEAPHQQVYGSVAVIADPKSPLRDDLTHSNAEAAAIAAALPAKILTGDNATGEKFFSVLGRYPAVHFSGHSELIARGDSGRLLMTPDAEHPEGAVYGSEVRAAHVSGTLLVVLISCDSAAGRVNSARVASVARDFIEAGVPRVVASLWRVDDAASTYFSSAFYRALARGEGAEKALQTAQNALASTVRFRSPRFWASLTLYRSERL